MGMLEVERGGTRRSTTINDSRWKALDLCIFEYVTGTVWLLTHQSNIPKSLPPPTREQDLYGYSFEAQVAGASCENKLLANMI
jgi:hypothetical protein